MGILALHISAAFAISLTAARARTFRWRRTGLTEREADRLAVSLGLHPSHLWPSWWAAGAEEAAI